MPFDRLRAAALGGALAVCSAMAAAPGLVLALEGPGPYYRLALPAAIYTLSSDGQLADLRLINAAGDRLAWAWDASAAEAPAAPPSWSDAPLFALPLAQSQAQAEAYLSVGSDGRLVWRKLAEPPAAPGGWIIDAHAVAGRLQQLSLQWAPDWRGELMVRVDASDDLRSWRTAVPQAPLLDVSQAQRVLKVADIDLGGLGARYVKLTPLGQPASLPTLVQASVSSRTDALHERAGLQWSAAWAPTSCTEAECLWLLPPHLPVDALDVALGEDNSVAEVELLAEDDAPKPAALERSINPLHSVRRMRHRDRDAATSPQQLLFTGSLWRLSLQGEAGSLQPHAQGVIDGDGAAHARLRLRATRSAVDWQRHPPRLKVGTQRPVLRFLMRGAGPVTLQWGTVGAPGAAMAMAGLVPPAEQVRVRWGQAQLELPMPEAPRAASGTSTAVVAAATKPSRMWLWAVLGAGLLLLVAMAYAVLRETSKAKGEAPSP